MSLGLRYMLGSFDFGVPLCIIHFQRDWFLHSAVPSRQLTGQCIRVQMELCLQAPSTVSILGLWFAAYRGMPVLESGGGPWRCGVDSASCKRRGKLKKEMEMKSRR